MQHIAIVAKQGERVYEGLYIQNVNASGARIKGLMRPFKGVASKYLPRCLEWRRDIELDGDRLTPLHILAEAME